jgi:hypothetical protein
MRSNDSRWRDRNYAITGNSSAKAAGYGDIPMTFQISALEGLVVLSRDDTSNLDLASKINDALQTIRKRFSLFSYVGGDIIRVSEPIHGFNDHSKAIKVGPGVFPAMSTAGSDLAKFKDSLRPGPIDHSVYSSLTGGSVPKTLFEPSGRSLGGSTFNKEAVLSTKQREQDLLGLMRETREKAENLPKDSRERFELEGDIRTLQEQLFDLSGKAIDWKGLLEQATIEYKKTLLIKDEELQAQKRNLMDEARQNFDMANSAAGVTMAPVAPDTSSKDEILAQFVNSLTRSDLVISHDYATYGGDQEKVPTTLSAGIEQRLKIIQCRRAPLVYIPNIDKYLKKKERDVTIKFICPALNPQS